jgi:hypothetical protein
MTIMKRKLVIGSVALLVLGGVSTIIWLACGRPPPRLVLKYGFPPHGGPTGRTLILEVPVWRIPPDELRPTKLEFIEIDPGYRWVRKPPHETESRLTLNPLQRLLGMLRLSRPTFSLDITATWPHSAWDEMDQTIWIAKEGAWFMWVDQDGISPEAGTRAAERYLANLVDQHTWAGGSIRLATRREWEFGNSATAIEAWRHSEEFVDESPGAERMRSFWGHEYDPQIWCGSLPVSTPLGLRLVWIPPGEGE